MSNHDFDLDLPTPTWKQFQEVFFSVIEKRNLLKTFSNTLVETSNKGVTTMWGILRYGPDTG